MPGPLPFNLFRDRKKTDRGEERHAVAPLGGIRRPFWYPPSMRTLSTRVTVSRWKTIPAYLRTMARHTKKGGEADRRPSPLSPHENILIVWPRARLTTALIAVGWFMAIRATQASAGQPITALRPERVAPHWLHQRVPGTLLPSLWPWLWPGPR
jgi:hypothetical protein